jgi:2-amino-4-hydroxy-6-hydroxymethyldihydropteridine diphosphokinase/dihydroneopterin aldolase/2-amino-4-hydroxy-6-hydroxymethyldihydropteridine diphosphokinase
MVHAVVALGTNLGDRGVVIQDAVRELAETPGIEVTAVSPLLETIALRPDGRDEEAPRYLNGVALLETTLEAEPLLAVFHAIEARHGRERGERWGDRTLDLDLIVYGELQQQTELLTLPHPRAHERDFVLRPWLAVDPDAVLPGRGRVDELLQRLDAETLGGTA